MSKLIDITIDALDRIGSVLPDFLIENPIYRNKNARVLLFTVGAGYALSKLLCWTSGFFSTFFRFQRDISSRYGKGSWVVITGANEGIGKSYAFELARQGFNIVLVGRNEEKLKKAEQELHNTHPRVQTRIVVADFSKCYEEGWAEKIFEQVQHLDVSILINNAGQYVADYFYRIPIESIRNVILTNTLAHALVTRVFLPKLDSRLGKSAIINTASLAAASPKPFEQIYAATKAFHDYLSRGIAFEHPNIDILSMKPGPVQTALCNFAPPCHNRTSADDFVFTALSYVGRTKHTYGHWKHKLDHFVMDTLVPDFYRASYFKKRFNIK